MSNPPGNYFTRSGIIFVVSAPSGTGKSTICNNLRQSSDFVFSVSCTTRQPRKGEQDGEDYSFITRQQFEEKIAREEFLEYAEVHGNYYGTLKSHVLGFVQSGTDVILDIDVVGAREIRNCQDSLVKAALVDIFIMPPTMAELEKRLRKRGTETEEQIQVRLKTASAEITLWAEYQYTLLSETMEEDLIKFRAIIRAERYRSVRLKQIGHLNL
jgi:guanylate kinase